MNALIYATTVVKQFVAHHRRRLRGGIAEQDKKISACGVFCAGT